MMLRTRFAIVVVLGVFASLLVGAPAHAVSRASCSMTFEVSGWNGGFVASVIVRNTGDVAITWDGELDLTPGYATNTWGANFANTSMSTYNITPAVWGGVLSPGGAHPFGYTGVITNGLNGPKLKCYEYYG